MAAYGGNAGAGLDGEFDSPPSPRPEANSNSVFNFCQATEELMVVANS